MSAILMQNRAQATFCRHNKITQSFLVESRLNVMWESNVADKPAHARTFIAVNSQRIHIREIDKHANHKFAFCKYAQREKC